jgi:hypothetical protein
MAVARRSGRARPASTVVSGTAPTLPLAATRPVASGARTASRALSSTRRPRPTPAGCLLSGPDHRPHWAPNRP